MDFNVTDAELSELLKDLLLSYNVSIEVVYVEFTKDVINFFVTPGRGVRIRDVIELKNDISINFAMCLSIIPIIEKGVIQITIKIPTSDVENENNDIYSDTICPIGNDHANISQTKNNEINFKEDQMIPYICVGYYLKYPSGEPYILNEDEINFTNALIDSINLVDRNLCLNMDYKTLNTINFRIGPCQIGRVKLHGRKKGIQILAKDEVYWAEDIDINIAKAHIPKWIDYLKELIKGPSCKSLYMTDKQFWAWIREIEKESPMKFI